jgi:hypothetical protein
MADVADDYMDVTIVLQFQGLFTFAKLDNQVYVLLPRTDRDTGNPHGGFPPHRASLDIAGAKEPQNFGDCCLHVMPPGGSPQTAPLPPLMDLADITRRRLPRGHCRGAVNSRCHARIELGDTWQPSTTDHECFYVPLAPLGADGDGSPTSDCKYERRRDVPAWIEFRTVRRVRRTDRVDLGLRKLDRQHQKPQPFHLAIPAGEPTLTLVCRHVPEDSDTQPHHHDTHFDAYYDLYDRPVKRCPVRPCDPDPNFKSSSTKTCPSTKAAVD